MLENIFEQKLKYWRSIVEEVRYGVASWSKLARQYDVGASKIEEIARAKSCRSSLRALTAWIALIAKHGRDFLKKNVKPDSGVDSDRRKL
jgi:hypothetical protein